MGVCFNITGWNLLRLKNYLPILNHDDVGKPLATNRYGFVLKRRACIELGYCTPILMIIIFPTKFAIRIFRQALIKILFFDGSRGSKTWSYLLACFGKWKEFHYSYMFYLWFSSGIHQNQGLSRTVLQTSPVCQFWDPHFETKFFSWWK